MPILLADIVAILMLSWVMKFLLNYTAIFSHYATIIAIGSAALGVLCLASMYKHARYVALVLRGRRDIDRLNVVKVEDHFRLQDLQPSKPVESVVVMDIDGVPCVKNPAVPGLAPYTRTWKDQADDYMEGNSNFMDVEQGNEWALAKDREGWAWVAGISKYVVLAWLGFAIPTGAWMLLYSFGHQHERNNFYGWVKGGQAYVQVWKLGGCPGSNLDGTYETVSATPVEPGQPGYSKNYPIDQCPTERSLRGIETNSHYESDLPEWYATRFGYSYDMDSAQKVAFIKQYRAGKLTPTP